MAQSYSEARATALEIISFYGYAGTVVKKGTTGGYDSSGNATADIADITINGTITPMLDYISSEIDGEMIKKGDGYVFFHSDDAPEIGMQVTIDSNTFRIINITSLDSGTGINVYRQLQLRK